MILRSVARNSRLYAIALIGVLSLAAYVGGFYGPFVFDDPSAIVQNTSIEHIWPPWEALHPPAYRTVSGRPIANFSLAINYALGGTDPSGYHVGNWLIHLLAGLALYGIVRRTLGREPLVARFRAAAVPLALTTALVWLLHPLQTEAVTYVIQRVESLMGLFYLLTLYCFVRGMEPAAGRGWLVLAVLSCLLGMGTKEVMVSAPLLVFLYDRTFVAGSFRLAWEKRRRFYLGLAATWIWLAILVIQTNGRSGTAGPSAGVSSWSYLLTQCRAIVHYLWLCIWPSPLIFDYGTRWVRDWSEVVPQALALLALVAGTIWALRRRPVLGFLGVWFFAILAPSSSFVPVVTQSMAEHRMYLSLAAVAALAVIGSFRFFGGRSLMIWPAVVLGLGTVTFHRNLIYCNAIDLWEDTVAKCPDSPRAYDGLGNALVDAGRLPEAVVVFQRAIQLDPDFVRARNNLGVTYDKLRQTAAAIREFEDALAIKPEFGAARYNLANAYAAAGRPADAEREYLAVLRTKPADPDLLERLAGLEMQSGEVFSAVEHYRSELVARPTAIKSRFNLAYLLAGQGRWSEAQEVLREGIRLDPNNAMAHYNLGNAFIESHELEAASEEYKRAAELDPKLVPAHYNLGNTLALLKRYPEAARQYERVLELDPSHVRAQENLKEVRRHLAPRPDSPKSGD